MTYRRSGPSTVPDIEQVHSHRAKGREESDEKTETSTHSLKQLGVITWTHFTGDEVEAQGLQD